MERLVDWDLILRYTIINFPIHLPVILSKYFIGKTDDQISLGDEKKLSENDIIIRNKFLKNRLILNSLPKNNLYSNDGIQVKPDRSNKVSIIITGFDGPENLQVCIDSIKSYTAADRYELVIIYDNKIITDNITGITNDIVLINGNIIVTPGWLDYLSDINLPDTGVVVPRQAQTFETGIKNKHVPDGNPNYELDITLSDYINNIKDPFTYMKDGYVELYAAPYSCALIKRECIDVTGWNAAGNDGDCDSMEFFCNEAIKNGYKILYTPYSKIYTNPKV